MVAPPGGGRQAFGEAAWMSEVGKVTARGPDRDAGLGKHVSQPGVVVGSDLAAGDEQVGHLGGAQDGQPGGGILGELGRTVQQFPQVTSDQVLPRGAGRPE
jgi:hypothetical protein